MSKSRRLLELMMTANRKRTFTAKELADEFKVSTRTIVRDLQELGGLGFPLYSETGPRGGYRVLNERQLPPISFMENEAVAIFFASKSLEHYNAKPFEGEFGSALSKFYHHLPQDTKKRIDQLLHRVEFRTPRRELPSCDLSLLLEAAIHQQVVTIVYDSKDGPSVRNIQPVGIYTENGFWYCPAYCFIRKSFRLFRADRILSAKAAEDQSSCQAFESITLDNWKQFKTTVSDRKTFLLKVIFNRDGIRQIRRERWIDSEALTAHENGGELSTEITADQLDYLASLFLGLGDCALVLEPEQLVARMRQCWRSMGERYQWKNS